MAQGLQVASRRRRRLRHRAASSREAIADRRLLRLEYYKANEDEFSERTRRALRADQRPRGLVRRVVRPRHGRRAPLPPGPHQARARSPTRASSRGPRSTRPPTSTAGRAPARSRPRAPRACGSRPSARAGCARSAAVAQELADGAVVVELPFAGTDWLVREVLKEAGDAACSSRRTRARPCAPRPSALPVRGAHREPPRPDPA